MRAIAISIVVFSGAFMAVGGAVAEAMPSSRRVCYADEVGLVIAVVGVVMLALEMLANASRDAEKKAKP